MQINHPGRVVQKDLADLTWAPSSIPVEIGKFSSLYPVPRTMTVAEIDETVRRFAETACAAQSAGFDGVQIHAAHGYLLSQFLTPLVNRRDDAWGGPLENRARMLLEVVRAVRHEVGAGFAVAVKLNSADFPRGGFDTEDAKVAITMLAAAGVDLVELSGGSIESPVTAGAPADGRMLAREAYFLDLAQRLVTESPLPLLLTGGIRRRAVAEQVLSAGFAMVGLATALAIDPDLPRRWLTDPDPGVQPPRTYVRDKVLAAVAVQAAMSQRLARLARGKPVRPPLPPTLALAVERSRRFRQRRAYRAWRRALT